MASEHYISLVKHGSGEERYLGLHGWSGSHRTFDPLLEHLPPGASLYAADLPGCGASPATPWTLAAFDEAIAAAIRKLAPVTIIGQCSGGLLGMHAALQAPDAVRRFVLIDPLAYWPWYFRVFTLPGLGRHAYMTTFANPLGRWLTNASLRGRRARQTNLTDGFGGAPHEVLLGHLEVLRQIPQPGVFHALRAPIDIAYGRRTFRAVRESVAVWREMWPQATITELAAAGHLPILEATEEISRIVFRR
jgi:pimeloyl-ACP methyl ester carboxylesterase